MISANIITFNPNVEVLQNAVNSLEHQVDKIIIINNSDYDVLIKSSKVIVVNLGGNFGIAKAQSIGMEKSFSEGADFVLQMDQDSEVPDGMVDKLLASYRYLESKGYNIGLIGPLDFDKITGHVNKARLNKGKLVEERYSFVDSTLSSGSLIPKKAYLSIGGMYNDLFIDIVDHEYCWRLGASGFDVVRDNSVKLPHRIGNGKKKILGLISVGVPAPFRHYYAVRNTLFLMRKSYPPLKWKLTAIPKIMFKLLMYPFFLDHGASRFKFIIKGIIDGVTGKLGKYSE